MSSERLQEYLAADASSFDVPALDGCEFGRISRDQTFSSCDSASSIDSNFSFGSLSMLPTLDLDRNSPYDQVCVETVDSGQTAGRPTRTDCKMAIASASCKVEEFHNVSGDLYTEVNSCDVKDVHVISGEMSTSECDDMTKETSGVQPRCSKLQRPEFAGDIQAALVDQIQKRPSTYNLANRSVASVPTSEDIRSHLQALRQKVEQAAMDQTSTYPKRKRDGLTNQAIHDLSLQLDVLTQDYQKKLLAYLDSYGKAARQQHDLVDERNQILQVDKSAYEAKVGLLICRCNQVVNGVLAKCAEDAYALLGTYQTRAKKKEKLDQSSIVVLNNWLQEHFINPYPTNAEKQMLMAQTGLTLRQLNQWFINARVRKWRPAMMRMHDGMHSDQPTQEQTTASPHV